MRSSWPRRSGPYLLVGGSWDGLLAAMYAATYPREVSGMVLLDQSLPTENEMDARFIRKKHHLTADSWKQETERTWDWTPPGWSRRVKTVAAAAAYGSQWSRP
jgi:pimeloyl-ACP methyl ester carboxylesterase